MDLDGLFAVAAAGLRARPGKRACSPGDCPRAENSKWEHEGQDYFVGEVEPCINGMAVAIGAYFGADVRGIVERLLGEQLGDGGWNCEAENGSTRSSFHTTIGVLEGLLEYERATGKSADLAESRSRGEHYLLERRMMR